MCRVCIDSNKVHASIIKKLRLISMRWSYIHLFLSHEKLIVYQAFESHIPNSIHFLSVSNTTLLILCVVYEASTIKSAVTQNSFCLRTRYNGSKRPCSKILSTKRDRLSESLDTERQLLYKNVAQQVSKGLEPERDGGAAFVSDDVRWCVNIE